MYLLIYSCNYFNNFFIYLQLLEPSNLNVRRKMHSHYTDVLSIIKFQDLKWQIWLQWWLMQMNSTSLHYIIYLFYVISLLFTYKLFKYLNLISSHLYLTTILSSCRKQSCASRFGCLIIHSNMINPRKLYIWLKTKQSRQTFHNNMSGRKPKHNKYHCEQFLKNQFLFYICW